MRAPDPDPARVEHGVQVERTALAWTRTALAVVVNGALLIRLADAPALQVLGVLASVAGCALVVHANRRYRLGAAAVSSGRSPADRTLVRATGIGTLTLCAVALTAIVGSL